MKRSPAAITGMGCICGAGDTLGDCIDALFQGSRNPSPPSRFTSSHGVSYPVFEAPETAIRPELKDIEHISLTGKLAITAAYEALANAGLESHEVKGKKIGVCIGTTVGSVMNDIAFYAEFCNGGAPGLEAINRFLRSNPAAWLARDVGLTGPCQTVVNACSSSTNAFGIVASWVQSGRCDMVIAGGTDELSRVTYNGFISLMITDETPCKPFDRDRKGLNLGEGSAMLILESEQSWGCRKKNPRAIVLGYGSSSDAHHLTAPHPNGDGLRRAISEALNISGASPDSIAFVNAHGTGTPDNDRVESKVFSELLPGIPFVSTKGFTGHTLGAAGAIEAAFTVACLERSMIPGSAGFTNPDPDLPATPVSIPTAVKGSMAISQSLAFGGCNSVLIFGNGRE